MGPGPGPGPARPRPSCAPPVRRAAGPGLGPGPMGPMIIFFVYLFLCFVDLFMYLRCLFTACTHQVVAISSTLAISSTIRSGGRAERRTGGGVQARAQGLGPGAHIMIYLCDVNELLITY